MRFLRRIPLRYDGAVRIKDLKVCTLKLMCV